MVQFTEAMITKGFEQGMINLIMSPNGGGVVCKIGNGTLSNWFYFGGYIAAICDSVENYKQKIPQDIIVQEIVEVLNDYHNLDEDEQLFYYYVLKDSKAISIHDKSENCDYWVGEAMKKLITENIERLLDGEKISNVCMKGKQKQLYLSSKGQFILENE